MKGADVIGILILLAIIIAVFRSRKTLNIDELRTLNG